MSDPVPPPDPDLAGPSRFRLMVVSPTIPDVVRGAGGWLFDQVTLGWSARVLTAERSDPRPLHILGARGYDLRGALGQPLRTWPPQAISVQASLYHGDARIRGLVARARDEGLCEVMLWDAGSRVHAADEASVARHQLSIAAQAFKAQALRASQLHPQASWQDAAVDGTETFLRVKIPD
jgi:hypothetical protein